MPNLPAKTAGHSHGTYVHPSRFLGGRRPRTRWVCPRRQKLPVDGNSYRSCPMVSPARPGKCHGREAIFGLLREARSKLRAPPPEKAAHQGTKIFASADENDGQGPSTRELLLAVVAGKHAQIMEGWRRRVLRRVPSGMVGLDTCDPSLGR